MPGERMLVASLPSGPFFLESRQHDVLQCFVNGPLLPHVPQLIALVGPIKSGKSAVMQSVLPGLFAAQYSLAGGPTPIVLCFAFSLKDPPDVAALRLLRRAAVLAKSLGFVLEVPDLASNALNELADVMGDFAQGVASRGGVLCLNLDEVQVSGHQWKSTRKFPCEQTQAPVLAAANPADALRFATKLKDVVTACMSNSRIAITGSGMVTLLNTLHNVPVNGYCVWDAMQRVHLGATPSNAAALAMATALVQHRAASWPPTVVARVTPSVLFEWLRSSAGARAGEPFLCARPALVAYLADQMRGAMGDDAEELLRGAQDLVLDKVLDEASVDAAVALGQLSRPMLAHIARLVRGELTLEMLVAGGGRPMGLRTFREMLLVLCEPQTAMPLKLLPPYGRLFSALLSSDGTLLVCWRGGEWELNEQLRNRLKFFAEYSGALLHRQAYMVRRISAAVLSSFAANGIGFKLKSGGHRAPVTLAELAAEPAFEAVRFLLASQGVASNQSSDKLWKLNLFNDLLAAERDGLRSAEIEEYCATAGFHVLHWWCMLAAHDYLPMIPLVDAGLTVGIIDEASTAAVKVWIGGNISVAADGAPIMPIKLPRGNQGLRVPFFRFQRSGMTRKNLD